MTRLAVLADIHGNLPALEAVMSDMVAWSIDYVVVAGDLIHWGPFSAAVVERVRAEGWAVIRGNHEFYLLDYNTPRAPVAWSDTSQWGALAWLHTQFDVRQRRLIAAWPDTLCLAFDDAPPVRVVHGSPRGHRDGLYPTDSNAAIVDRLAGTAESTVIAAHTHLPLERHPGGWHVLNPGSVGVPFHGRHEASYLILDGVEAGWRATFRRVPFDPAPLLAELDRQHAADAWGALGPLLLEEFATAEMRIGACLRWLETRHPGARLTEALVAAFRRTDPWDHIPLAYHHARVRPPVRAPGPSRGAC
ncbi:MAG: metallophosphoesterase family protein [Chloroflexi bacterium]|nr:metallophosphoesterase family protein [Chloroflexota bacterium]